MMVATGAQGALERHCVTCRCFQPKPKRRSGLKRDAADARWSDAVRERDNWTCQWPGCGKEFTPHKAPGLHAAHCFGRRILATRQDLDNGLALCWPTHHTYADEHTNEKYALFELVLGTERFAALAGRARGKRNRT